MPQPAEAERLADRLVASQFETDGQDLLVGGVAVASLARDFGTPLFVYDAGLLRSAYRSLSRAVAGFAAVYFSAKANPNPEVLRVVLEAGAAGIEVASAAEYLRAREAGCAFDRILFAGPGKREEELALVLERGIGEIHLESREEIERLASLAERAGQRAPVGLRINPLASAQGGAMRMGGKPAPFGFDEEMLEEVVDAVERRPSLDLRGVHLFAGTQGLDADVLAGQWAHALNLARQVQARTGRSLATVDLGGGLGIPYFEGDRALDLDALAGHAARLAAAVADDPALAGTRIVLEPGRYLAGPAGLYVVRVLSAKRSRGTRFLVTDGGMHHHLAASGNLGQVIKRDYPIVAANRLREAATGPAVVVGPLCTPLDTIGRAVPLPDLAAGDLIAVLQSGAYGLTASPSGFLSHPMPAEVLVDRGSARLIRPRGTFEAPLVQLPTGGRPPEPALRPRSAPSRRAALAPAE